MEGGARAMHAALPSSGMRGRRGGKVPVARLPVSKDAWQEGNEEAREEWGGV